MQFSVFVGSELHDDAIVLKIGHSAAASVCPVDFRLTRDPFRLLEEVGFCCERTPVQLFRFVDMKPISDKGYHGGHSLLEFAREVRAAVAKGTVESTHRYRVVFIPKRSAPSTLCLHGTCGCVPCRDGKLA